MRDFKRLRAVAKLCLATMLMMVVVACSGGGGGGDGGGGGPSSNFPATVAVSVPENTPGPWDATSFQVYAPGTDAPTGLTLTGPDAAVFELQILVTDPPNAQGFRSVTLRIVPLFSANFERPRDADRNNVYLFTINGAFRGTTIATSVTVTISDIADIAEAPASYIVGETDEQRFALPLVAIPDVTGDGRPELGVSIRSGIGGATGYVLASGSIGGRTTPITNVTTLQSAGSRFSDKTPTGQPEANYVSASTSSGGVDLLVSDAGDSAFYLFPSLNAAGYAALRGSNDPATLPNRITYAMTVGDPQEARLVGDVNGDGLADIFTRSLSDETSGTYNLIMGRALASEADRQRTAAPDITMTYAWAKNTSGGITIALPRVTAQLIPDSDGDGFRDLVIIAPDYKFDRSDTNRGALWLIRSAVLRSTTPVTIDLEALTSTQGFKFEGRLITSVAETTDFDSDGYRTLLFSADAGAYAIDANAFGAINPATIPLDNGSGVAPPLFGAPSVLIQAGGWQLSGGSNPDLDGDGLEDVLASGAISPMANIFRGSRVRSALTDSAFNAGTSPGVYQVIPNTSPPAEAVNYPGQTIAAPPLFLSGTSLIAIPVHPRDTSQGFAPERAGRIIFVKTADITASIAKGETRMDVYLGPP